MEKKIFALAKQLQDELTILEAVKNEIIESDRIEFLCGDVPARHGLKDHQQAVVLDKAKNAALSEIALWINSRIEEFRSL